MEQLTRRPTPSPVGEDSLVPRNPVQRVKHSPVSPLLVLRKLAICLQPIISIRGVHKTLRYTPHLFTSHFSDITKMRVLVHDKAGRVDWRGATEEKQPWSHVKTFAFAATFQLKKKHSSTSFVVFKVICTSVLAWINSACPVLPNVKIILRSSKEKWGNIFSEKNEIK